MIKLSVTTAGFSECLSKDSGDSAGVCIISLNLPGPALWKKEEKKKSDPRQDNTEEFSGKSVLPTRYAAPCLSCSVLIPGGWPHFI